MNKEEIEHTVPESIVFNATLWIPEFVGGYRIGNHPTNYFQINLKHKPNFIQRFFMKTLLGFYWFDEKQTK